MTSLPTMTARGSHGDDSAAAAGGHADECGPDVRDNRKD